MDSLFLPVRLLNLRDQDDSKKNFRIFVGPSGCGKTRCIRSLLEHQWGFYLLPGTLQGSTERSMQPEDRVVEIRGEEIYRNKASQSQWRPNVANNGLADRLQYKPRRSGGSRDTQTWFDDVLLAYQFGHDFWKVADSLMDLLLRIRLIILGQFCKSDRTSHRPADWFKLQTNCDDPCRDIFNHVYRVCRFSQFPPAGFDTEHVPNCKLLFCLDEAQCDLEGHIPLERMTFKNKGSQALQDIQPLQRIICAVARAKTNIAGESNWKMALSGTALHLGETLQVIAMQAPEIRATVDHYYRLTQKFGYCRFHPTEQLKVTPPDLVPSIIRTFDLVEDDDDFKRLLRDRRLNIPQSVHDIIVWHSRALRGRYVWSVCYLDGIEELLKRKGFGDDRSSNQAVLEVSRTVYVMAKRGLRKRLEDMEMRPFITAMDGYDNLLRKPKTAFEDQRYHGPLAEQRATASAFQQQRLLREELLDELCWLAIRSDLLGETTIFKSSTSVDLVAHGFAFLDERDSAGSSVKLKERLAVDAAIEYFQNQKLSGGQSKYDRALAHFLYLEQNNSSALGKIAELFFAWVSQVKILSVICGVH